MAHENPHPCSCFGGFCWKNLCAERTINKAYAKATVKEQAPACQIQKSRTYPARAGAQISVWRDGVSYDGYSLPPGRIPPKQ